MIENVVLIDEQDAPLGEGEKLHVHRQGALHRAFSCSCSTPRARCCCSAARRASTTRPGPGRIRRRGHPRPGRTTAEPRGGGSAKRWGSSAASCARPASCATGPRSPTWSRTSSTTCWSRPSRAPHGRTRRRSSSGASSRRTSSTPGSPSGARTSSDRLVPAGLGGPGAMRIVPPGGGEVVGSSPERRVEILSDAAPLHATLLALRLGTRGRRPARPPRAQRPVLRARGRTDRAARPRRRAGHRVRRSRSPVFHRWSSTASATRAAPTCAT